MAKEPFVRLSVEEALAEIHKNGVNKFVRRAVEAGTEFFVGVDLIERNERIVVPFYEIAFNGGGAGCVVDLRFFMDLTPDRVHAPTIVQTTEARKDKHPAGSIQEVTNFFGAKHPVFRVSEKEHEQFLREADEIFKAYCHEGHCFQLLSDLWFPEMALIQFLREHVVPHPNLAGFIQEGHRLYKGAYIKRD